MATKKEQASLRTLEDTPTRVFDFLRGVNRVAAIRTTLETKGFDQDAYNEGWNLVLKVSGYSTPQAQEVLRNEEANEAQAELDQWDEGGFRIIRATLSRHHPAQAEFVLSGLGPSQGFAAVAGVAALLDRFDALESSPAREATRQEDHAALALLAKRGINKSERDRLRSLVLKVTQAQHAPAAAKPDDASKTKEGQYQADLGALRSWYDEWSEIARTVIRRRDWLILLGLARRKRSKASPEPETPKGG